MLHIKIVVEETNEVLIDETANCIIGAFGKGEEGECEMSLLDHCDPFELSATTLAAKHALKVTVEDKPEVQLLMKLVEGKENKENE